mgnify:CR=1 FL=1
MTSPALTLTLMIVGWLAVAVAMLWGMLRIAKRHHVRSPHVDVSESQAADPPPNRPEKDNRASRAHHVARLALLRHRQHWATGKH